MPLLDLRPALATAVNGAATMNQDAGIITTDALITAAQASYTLTIGCQGAGSSSVVHASLANGTNTQGIPVLALVKAGGDAIVCTIFNLHATQALNGTLQVKFVVFK